MSGEIEVRSYRVCFDIERRIHQVDRWRLPVPWGVPLRGVVYALVALGVVLSAGVLPGVGSLVGALPAPLRLVVFPFGVAAGLVRWRLDGRPAHRALFAVMRQSLGPRTLRSYRRQRNMATIQCYAPVAFSRDGAGGPLGRGRIASPARVSLWCTGVRRRGRRLSAEMDAADAGPINVDVTAGEVLEVRL